MSGAALITLGRRTRRGRPEWLRRHPISSRAAARRQSAQDAGGAAGKLGCGAARRSAQSRIREGCAPAGGVRQVGAPSASAGVAGSSASSLFPAPRCGATALLPSPLVPPECGGETRPSARPDSYPEPVGAWFSRRPHGAGSAPRAGFPDGPADRGLAPGLARSAGLGSGCLRAGEREVGFRRRTARPSASRKLIPRPSYPPPAE